MDEWRDQWSRTERWFARFREQTVGQTDGPSSEDCQDEVYAFFQSAYHLKDWLKHSGAPVADVEAFINGSPELCICADLCNGSKHLRLTTPHADAGTGIASRSVTINAPSAGLVTRGDVVTPVQGTGGSIQTTYGITSGGRTYDAFALAEECMKQWERYLQGKGLLS